MAAQESNFLTAQELVHLRGKVKKTLPIKGTKEFQPSDSWLEKKQIQTALDERKFLLEEERIERLGSLARADWDPELKVANVTHRVGRHWKLMGHEVGGQLLLFPEEALFLLETNCLELVYDGVPLSIQHGYSILLGPDTGCTFNEYQTYLHLVRQGYILLRHSDSVRATRYERQIRLHQHSVGQKQHKKKDDAVEVVFIEDGNTDTAINKHSSYVNKSNNNVKDEQEIIDVETVEPDIVDDSVSSRKKDKNTYKKYGVIEKSNSSAEKQNLNGIIMKSQNCIKTVSAEKEISKAGDSINGGLKVESMTSEIEPSTVQLNRGSFPKHTENNMNIGKRVEESQSEVAVSLLNNNVTNLQEIETNCASNRANVDGENTRLCTIAELQDTGSEDNKRVHTEIVKANAHNTNITREKINSQKHAQSSNGGIISENTSVCDTNTIENSTSKLVKRVDQVTSGKVSDIVLLDDSSASLDESEKDTFHNMKEMHQSGEESNGVRISQTRKQVNDSERSLQKLPIQCSDIVDISDGSQISQLDADSEFCTQINSCDIQNRISSSVRDDIEEVSIVENTDIADDEVVEIDEVPLASVTRNRRKGRRRKSAQNIVGYSTQKNEVIHSNVVKPDICDIVEVQSLTTNSRSSGMDHTERRQSSVMVLSEKKRVTTVDLKHEEVEIVPRVVDLSEEERKFDCSSVTKDVKPAGKSEIEVVNLDDEEVRPELSWEEERRRPQLSWEEERRRPQLSLEEERRRSQPSWEEERRRPQLSWEEERRRPELSLEEERRRPELSLEEERMRPELSWEEERMRILDSIPSIDGKFVVHVSVPDKSLLPPNICPQKKDYYIQKWRLTAPDIGGKPKSGFSGTRDYARWQEQSFSASGQINPWIQYPANYRNMGGGGNVFGSSSSGWTNNTFPLSGPFMNHHYQSQYSGAYEFQSMFYRAFAMLSALGSAFPHGGMFGFPPHLPVLHGRNQYGSRPWNYHSRPYYRRPYYRRRYPYRRYENTQYNRITHSLGEQNRETQTNGDTDIIPFTVEEETTETKVKVSIKEVDDDDDEDIDVIECKPSPPLKKTDNEPMEWTSFECPQPNSNKIGVELYNVERRRKRRGSRTPRFSSPPKKIKGFMEKLRTGSLEDTRRNNPLKEEAETSRAYPEESVQDDVSAADVKTWRDLKSVLQVVVLDSSSEEDSEDDGIYVVDDSQESDVESNVPLVQPEDCKDTDSILKKLQVIKPTNPKQEKSLRTNESLKISFDMYMPNTSFRKASPGLPNYRIFVVGHEDPVPEPSEVLAVLEEFEDNVPLLFAVVLPDTVTFFQFSNVQLPVESFCP